MTCTCLTPNFHDYDCNVTPKCEHCQARIDIGPLVCHSYNCPTHVRCEYCNIPENLERQIHHMNCPKWGLPVNQRRILEISRDIRFRIFNRFSLLHVPIPRNIPNMDHLRCETQEECPICQEGESNIKTNCGHYFHQNCLETWCRISLNCPICRNPNAI